MMSSVVECMGTPGASLGCLPGLPIARDLRECDVQQACLALQPRLRSRKSSDLLVRGKSPGRVARVLKRAVDQYVELTRAPGLHVDVVNALGLQRVPHPEGLRLVASTAAVVYGYLHNLPGPRGRNRQCAIHDGSA